VLAPARILLVAWLGVASVTHAQATPGDTLRTRSLDSALFASVGRARVRVTSREGHQGIGLLVAADDTLLSLRPDRRPRFWSQTQFWPQSSMVYDRRNLTALELSERSERRGRMTAIGAVAGVAVGAVIGSAILGSDCSSANGVECHGRRFGAWFGGAVGSAVGGLFGRHVIARDRWRNIPVMGEAR
jgi:hypothetical protein